jgi:putative copper export protein
MNNLNSYIWPILRGALIWAAGVIVMFGGIFAFHALLHGSYGGIFALSVFGLLLSWLSFTIARFIKNDPQARTTAYWSDGWLRPAIKYAFILFVLYYFFRGVDAEGPQWLKDLISGLAAPHG